MAIIHVPTDQPTIQAAVNIAGPNDIIRVELSYATPEIVLVSNDNLIFDGLTTQTGITLNVGPGVTVMTMTGTTPFNAVNNTGGCAINGNNGNNILTVNGGNHSVSGGGVGDDDVLVIDYSSFGSAFGMNGPTIISNFINTSVLFTNFERFNATFGSGNDTIVLLGGNDIINGGGGDDSLNTAAGAAVVDGGAGGNDLWIADFSGDATAKNINLNLAGIQAAGNGTTYVNIERMNINGGAGNDILTSRTGNPNDGFTDTLNGGLGNDTLTVGGGNDTVDGGVGGDDLLVIDYSTDSIAFLMNGPAIITDFTNTSVSFSNIERFNATFGSGNDVIVLLGGNDVINGGGGDDSLNTAAGAAVVDGGIGDDLWIADFSSDASVKNINLNLAGIQAAGNGTTYVNIERMNINGGAGNDILTSRTGNPNDGFVDTLNGGAGNDTLTVGGGNDIVDGGVGGDDLLVIDYSTDSIAFFMNGAAQINDFTNTSVSFSNIERFNATFGSGNDVIVLLGGNDIINGGGGNDSLNTAAGAAIVDGGAGGNDLWIADFSGDATAKNINLNLAGIQAAGNGTTYVNIERMTITGGAGNDILTSRTSNANDGFDDTLFGGLGDDTLTVGGGSDSVDGGVGGDDVLVIDYSTDTGAFSMNGVAQINDFTNTSVSFTNIERFNATFGSGNDVIVLLGGNDVINGGAGDDSLNTAAGAAVVDGGAGGNDLWIADFSGDASVKNINLNLAGIQTAGNGTTYVNIERMNITGGAGDDVLTSRTSNANDGFIDTLNGGLGNDTLTVGGGADVVDGGVGGDDVLVIDYSTDASSFSMANATFIADFINTSVSYANIERFNATFGAGNDTIVLLGGADIIEGGDGTDNLTTAGGNDTFIASGASDGIDVYDGGSDDDTLTYALLAGANGISVTLNGAAAVTVTVAGGDNDTISSIENITGGAGADIIAGDGNANVLNGNGGADILNGGANNDTLDGGGGVDVMTGGQDDDTYYVDDALDTVSELSVSGSGNDVIFASASYTNALNVERLTLTGAGNLNATGRDGQDEIIEGNSGNNVLDGKSGIDTMRGGLGNDNYYVDNIGDVTDETGGGGIGDYVLTTVSFTAAAGIERVYLQGSANINATGRDGQVDFLLGNSGNNVLDGKSGIDTMRGGLGNDTYYVDNSADVTDEVTGGGGIGDYVFASASFTAAAGIERIYLQGAANINATGRDGQVDFLLGNSGNNVLDGKGGIDTMRGGLGNDTYIINSATDNIIELAGEGTGDRASASLSFALAAGDNIEFLDTTNAAGLGLINLTGNEIAQTIAGNAGANILNGGIDALSDNLVGRLGNDTYIINSANDNIIELAGEGTGDRASASLSFILSAGDNIEFLDTTNAAGLGAINLTGNEIAQTIAGNAGANILNGGIDALSDNLVGRLGNDTYIINSATDNIIELAGEGTGDRASASVSFILAAGDNIEFLDTTNAAGVGAINLTGNEIAQTIAGNAGANILNGGIDAVSDILVGRLGNDTFIINSATDNIVENAGEGTADRASASLSFILAAGDNIEFLETTNAAGLGLINLTGNEIAQTIIGNAGANILNGKGGNDTLQGNAGLDTYRFDTVLGAGNLDQIIGFSSVDDRIELDNAVFIALGAAVGPLAASMFQIGAAANDVFDRIIYNNATGALLYDADGNTGGGVAAIQFANLQGAPAAVLGDFFVI